MKQEKETIVIINGPNLNLLGIRQKGIYGEISFREYLAELYNKFPQYQIKYHQTNHEGVIIDLLHEHGFSAKGILLNAGGYTHSSIAIRDGISSITSPVIEIHISDIKNRESFRKTSMIEEVCAKSIIGKGLNGYKLGIQEIINLP
jgi:3-dehydroquinate dehydratase-2